jgi:serine protease Do
LRNLVANAGGGTKVSLDVIRDGEERRFDVALGELPAQEQPAKRVERRAETLRGLEVEPLNASTRRRFDIPSQVDEGVVVVGVAAESPAGRAGLRPGDVILEVGRRRISSPEELASRLGQMDARTVLLISRRGKALYMSIDGAP